MALTLQQLAQEISLASDGSNVKHLAELHNAYLVDLQCQNCRVLKRNFAVPKGQVVSDYAAETKCKYCGVKGNWEVYSAIKSQTEGVRLASGQVRERVISKPASGQKPVEGQKGTPILQSLPAEFRGEKSSLSEMRQEGSNGSIKTNPGKVRGGSKSKGAKKAGS